MRVEDIYAKAFVIPERTPRQISRVKVKEDYVKREDKFVSRIWQSMSEFKRKEATYRRDIIHNYYKTTLHLTDDTDCLLLSQPNKEDIDKALDLRKNGRFIRIVYDRSDCWDDRESDDYCVANSDIVINSSKWLYQHCSNSHKVYIPNRCIEYPVVEKERKNIAVYCGYDARKVDVDWLNDWINDHKDIEFECYTKKPIKGLEKYWKGFISEDKLFDHLLECKYGLLPLNRSRWAKGMLPLKYFLYRNAGLIVERTDVAKHNTEEFDNIDHFSWNDVIEDFRPYIDIEEWTDCYESHLRWFVGYRCNYRCPYCCQTGSHSDKLRDLSKDIEMINKLKPSRVLMIGGEPTLYDLPSVLSQIDWTGIKSFRIFTNLSKDADWYISLHKISDAISLSASLHLNMCDANKFLDKVRKIQSSGMKVLVTYCVDDSNIDKYKALDWTDVKGGARAIRDNNRPRKMSDETKEWIRSRQSSSSVAAFNSRNNGYVGYGLICKGKPCLDNGVLYSSGWEACRRVAKDLNDTSVVCPRIRNCSLCMSQMTRKMI